jgi:hypothetical protein
MPKSTYFVQECPTCGRSLHVRVEYLGRQVMCQHCRGRFEACDSAIAGSAPADSGINLLERADKLLESVQPMRAAPRPSADPTIRGSS